LATGAVLRLDIILSRVLLPLVASTPRQTGVRFTEKEAGFNLKVPNRNSNFRDMPAFEAHYNRLPVPGRKMQVSRRDAEALFHARPLMEG
jgi:hypothetical protein